MPIQLETRRQTSFTTDQVLVTTPTDEVIGEVTAASGWPAEVTCSGLTEGELTPGTWSAATPTPAMIWPR